MSVDSLGTRPRKYYLTKIHDDARFPLVSCHMDVDEVGQLTCLSGVFSEVYSQNLVYVCVFVRATRHFNTTYKHYKYCSYTEEMLDGIYPLGLKSW
jgi:hypothetical protein